MKKLGLFMFSGLLFLSGMSFAAEVTVPSGEDIQTYIDAAADGDVILLESGGVYEGQLTISKTITLKAVDGYTVRPVINSTSTDAIKFGGVKNGRVVKINGIEFASDGSSRYLLRFATDDSLSYLEVSDLVAHGYDRSFLRASDAGTNIDSVLIDNVYCYDFGGDTYRLFYFDGEDCPVNYFKVVNSSFVDFNRTFLQLTSSVKKTVIVDHCNIHGRTDLRLDDLFDIDGAEGSTFDISNTIISSIKLAKIWDIKATVEDNISNVSYFDIEVPADMIANIWTSETAFIEQDPMFTNGAAGALYLDAASPALTASTTSGPLGDPRWAAAPAEASLLHLSVDLGSLSFNTATLDYNVQLPFGTTTVNVDAIPNSADAVVTGTGAVDVSSGDGVASVLVTAGDASTQTYTVTFAVTPASADASLSSLVITTKDGTAFDLVPVFDPSTLNYTLELPAGTDSVFVDAVTNYATATLTATDTVAIDALSGTATVVVTAEDGSTIQTYTVALTVSTVGVEMNPMSDIRLYHSAGMSMLKVFNSSDVEMLEVYNITGRLLSSINVHNQSVIELSTSELPNGVYLVRMKLSENRTQALKFVK